MGSGSDFGNMIILVLAVFVLIHILFICFYYLVGSINGARIVSFFMGFPTPTSLGSGNPGSTNMLRIGGKCAALLTFLVDFLKGILPFAIPHINLPIVGVLVPSSQPVPATLIAFLGLFIVLGDLYPIYHRFVGGKGISVIMGICLALNPWLFLAMLITWVFVAGLSRYSSLAGIVSCVLMPLCAFWLTDGYCAGYLVIASLLILHKHRTNIKRLWEGSERKIGDKLPPAIIPTPLCLRSGKER